MELNQQDGYWRVTLDLADGKISSSSSSSSYSIPFSFDFYSGIYHYQYKIVTKSWFEPEPEPALPDYTNDETKSKLYLLIVYSYY